MTRRIYVACLAAYNSGYLHGAWIDVTGLDAAALQDHINQILRTSPIQGAEEWAIHDYEGFGDLLGEYSGLDRVCALAAFIDEHGDLGLAVASECGGNLDEAQEMITDCYIGEYETVAAYAEEIAGDCYSVPEEMFCYIDFRKMARDLCAGGGITTIKSKTGHHLFHPH